MKGFLVLFSLLVSVSLTAQSVDVTAYSQNKAFVASYDVEMESGQQQTASYPSITETYQIPSFDLYDEYWDVKHLRSRRLQIPFSDESRLMIILVAASNNPFEVPCSFDDISLRYGPTRSGDFHPGVDLKVGPQTLVKSCFDGVVRMSKLYGDYGLTVVIRHYNGLETVYGHLDKTCVKPGQMVKAGDVIGQTGKTGNCKDYLLHFETRFLNECFDPELIVDFENETLMKNTLVLSASDLFITELEEVGRSSVNTPSKTEYKPVPAKAEPKPVVETTQNTKPETIQDVKNDLKQAFDGEEVYHIIQKGETLYRISLQYKTTTAEILRLNNIDNADKVTAGQRIRVK